MPANKSIRNRSFIALSIVLLFAASLAYSGSIVNSRHDLTYVISTSPADMSPYITNYGEICVYCHTPHAATTDAPLWNRNLPAGPYTIYNTDISSTMDATVGQPNSISMACLSCHDGTIAVDQILNAPGSGANTYDLAGTQYYYGVAESSFHYKMKAGGGACGVCHFGPPGVGHDSRPSYLGTDLTDDHPISMDYNDLTAQFGTEFNTPDDTQKGWNGDDIKLFSGYVECPSCHNVHDPDYTPFLRIANTNSALCIRCHIK